MQAYSKAFDIAPVCQNCEPGLILFTQIDSTSEGTYVSVYIVDMLRVCVCVLRERESVACWNTAYRCGWRYGREGESSISRARKGGANSVYGADSGLPHILHSGLENLYLCFSMFNTRFPLVNTQNTEWVRCAVFVAHTSKYRLPFNGRNLHVIILLQSGCLRHFFLEDWQYVNEHRHVVGENSTRTSCPLVYPYSEVTWGERQWGPILSAVRRYS